MKKNAPLAIKYRPKNLGEVLGQDQVIKDLRGMVKSKRVPGTILLCGPHSSGKTTLGRLISLYLNCDELSKDGEPCGKCDSCRAMRGVISGNGAHPDVHEIDAASKRGIDDMRDLKEKAELAPTTNYRIFILDECQQLTKDAWGASLKLFERPPASTIFILCTTDPEVLPKTILSRSHRLVLKAVPIAVTSKLLRTVSRREGYTIPKKVRSQIAGIVDGHPREALHILESVFNHLDASGKSIDLEKAFPKILAQNNTYKSYMAAQDFVNGVIAGRFGEAFSAIKGSDNHTFFTTQIVLIMRTILEQIVDRSLVDRKTYWAISKVSKIDQNFGRKHVKEFASILKIFLQAQEKIKAYILDPLAVLETAAVDAISVVHIMNGKKGD